MKLNFILLAIVIAFIICYCFSKKKVQEGQISAAPQTSGALLSGYEDILIGVSDDYKLFKFNNPKKEWQQLRGKSCCVIDLGYWNSTLLGVGRYDHRLYAWDKMGVRGGLWKLATNLPMEWMQSIGVWKNKLFSANQQSIFRWTGIADGKNIEPFKRGKGNNPKWVWCGAKPNVKSIKEYRNQLYIVDKQGRVEMLVEGSLNKEGKLKGSWKRIGQPTEGLLSICEWNDKLMGIGTDNRLYEWSDERQNWFAKSTKFKLLSILSLTYDQYQTQFNKPRSPFSCANGFKLEPQEGKRCYRAEGEELDWWSAYNKCKDTDPGRKTTLAVISSKKENDFVKNLMQYPKWIGCADKDKEGEWKWPDGETLQKKGYSNWNQKEPNNADENEHYCEQYESGLWNDMPANAKRPYVCSHTTSLRREVGGKGGGRSCTEHKDKKKNYLYWNSNKWPATVKDKDDCKNRCENDPKCPQADYYEAGKRCYLYADNGSAGARRPKMTGSTPGETYFKCNTEAFRGSMKEGFREGQYQIVGTGSAKTCQAAGARSITTKDECQKAGNQLSASQLAAYGGAVDGQIYNYNGPSHPKGCFMANARPGWMYWNMHATGCTSNCSSGYLPGNHAVCGGQEEKETTSSCFGIAGYTSSLSAKWRKMSKSDVDANANKLREFYTANKGFPILADFTHNNCCIMLESKLVLHINGTYAYGAMTSQSCPNGKAHKKGQKMKLSPGGGTALESLDSSHKFSAATACGLSNNPTLFMAIDGDCPVDAKADTTKRGTDCGEVPFGKGWWDPGKGCYQTCSSDSQQRNEKRRCICGQGGNNQDCYAGTTCKNNECVPTRGTVKTYELAGDYDVYYGGGKTYPTKRTGSSGGSKGLQITCDGVATQPDVFTDKVHTSDVSSTCKDDAATFMIKKTHGANKYECLRKVGDKITGDHYVSRMTSSGHAGQLWGTVEYRKKANQDKKYKCQGPYQASTPSVGVESDGGLVFDNLTIGSAKERSAVFTLKKAAFITKIVFEHKTGRIMNHGAGSSNFGGDDNVALIISDKNRREILPNINVKGYKKTHHDSKTQAHWYSMDGVGRDSKKMTWELNAPQTFMPGDYHLWYNEDLTNWTESDNSGWATYKMTMEEYKGKTKAFDNQMLKDKNSGLCLGIEFVDKGSDVAPKKRVILANCQRNSDRLWSYDVDTQTLKNKFSNSCAIVKEGSSAHSTPIIMGSCDQEKGARHFFDNTKGSFYTENAQCFDIHSGAKSPPAANKDPGSLIQSPCHGGANQSFELVTPPPIPKPFPISSERNSAILVGKYPLTLKKGNLLRVINAEKNYRFEFTIIPTATVAGWGSIFRVTRSNKDCCGIGDRMPGIWFGPGTTRLHIRSGDKNDGNGGIDPPIPLPLNKETTVVVELNEANMSVTYTGAISWQSNITRSTDRPYGKAQVFAGDNFYSAAKATVKNVKWTNKTTPPFGKNTVTCDFNVRGKVNAIKYGGKDLKIYGDKDDKEVTKTVTFESNSKDPGKIMVDAEAEGDTDGCKTSGFIMSCNADSSNPWNDFHSNKTHWNAVGLTGRSFRDKSGFPCETAASNLSLKEGFRNWGFTRREGFVPGKKIWANTGQRTVKIEGGPRLSPEVSCPQDFHGVPLKITAWGNQHSNGTEVLQTVGGVFNIFNKDVGRLKGAHKIRVRPKQPKNGTWFADPIKERKTDAQGTLYLKTHMNSQWIRITNDYRECFKDATNIFVTSGELGSGNSGEQCSGGLQYILHPKGTLCPPKTQVKTKAECEKAVISLGIGKAEGDNYPWEKVLDGKSAAGCSWTDRAGGDGPATVKWNSWPNSSGSPTEYYHPVCYSKPPSQAAIELLETEGCHKCPPGTFSKEGSNECVVCTKNSTNPRCREGGKDQTSGLVCPAGTSSTGAVVTAEGKPMNLGEEQSSGNNSSETLKEQCKAFNSGTICDPPCNNTHGRCVGGMCMCGGGYRGPTCDEAPKGRIPTVEEWNSAFEANKDTKKAQEEANKPETVSYGYHEHTNMNKPFTDSLRELNKDVQELLVEARKQKEKKKKQRSFLPSEFLGWSNAIPGLLGKSYKLSAQPKPIDVGIAIDDRRKIHFRQRAKGKNTKLASVKSSPQVISSDAGKITSGSAQDDLKGANSFKNPKTANYRGFNDDSYLKGPDKPIEKAG